MPGGIMDQPYAVFLTSERKPRPSVSMEAYVHKTPAGQRPGSPIKGQPTVELKNPVAAFDPSGLEERLKGPKHCSIPSKHRSELHAPRWNQFTRSGDTRNIGVPSRPRTPIKLGQDVGPQPFGNGAASKKKLQSRRIDMTRGPQLFDEPPCVVGLASGVASAPGGQLAHVAGGLDSDSYDSALDSAMQSLGMGLGMGLGGAAARAAASFTSGWSGASSFDPLASQRGGARRTTSGQVSSGGGRLSPGTMTPNSKALAAAQMLHIGSVGSQPPGWGSGRFSGPQLSARSSPPRRSQSGGASPPGGGGGARSPGSRVASRPDTPGSPTSLTPPVKQSPGAPMVLVRQAPAASKQQIARRKLELLDEANGFLLEVDASQAADAGGGGGSPGRNPAAEVTAGSSGHAHGVHFLDPPLSPLERMEAGRLRSDEDEGRRLAAQEAQARRWRAMQLLREIEGESAPGRFGMGRPGSGSPARSLGDPVSTSGSPPPGLYEGFNKGAFVLPSEPSKFMGVPGDELRGGSPVQKLLTRGRGMDHWSDHADARPSLRHTLRPNTSTYLTLNQKYP